MNKPRASCLFALLTLFALLVPLLGTYAAAQPLAAQPAMPGNIGGCPMFPADNIWNRDISDLPGNPNSPYLASIGLSTGLHPDFGSGLYNGEPMGIPYIAVPSSQPLVPITFEYAAESDPGPYPFPPNVPIEGGPNSTGDRHALVVQSGVCKLYETFATYPDGHGGWTAGSGAMWNLNSNALRPDTWTSADAAGLPILPGLVRYDEVAAGAINHALRFTVDSSQRAYVWPARHYASSDTNPALPPMGLRVRLKASVDISGYPPDVQVILTALKHYGMIVADNGSSWFISGTQDDRWNNDTLHTIGGIHGSDFEVVDESSLMIDPNSGQARQPATATPCGGHFRDVCPDYWAYSYIEALATQGIMSGYLGGFFLPNNAVSRAEFAKILVLAQGWPLYTPASPSFSDVLPSHWAYAFVETVHQHGAISGYPDGSFQPTSLIRRDEMAKMVTLAHSLPAYTPPSGGSFSDAPPGYWAFGFVEAINHAGIMTGVGGGYFGVSDHAKRSETARIIYLMMQR